MARLSRFKVKLQEWADESLLFWIVVWVSGIYFIRRFVPLEVILVAFILGVTAWYHVHRKQTKRLDALRSRLKQMRADTRGEIERRKAPRVEVTFKVTLTFKGGRAEGVGSLINLSMGGCSIETTTRVEEGAFLDLTLQTPGGDQTIRSEEARVRWIRRGAFGVEFCNMGKEDQAKLGLLLRELKSQASLPPPSREPGRRPASANPSLKGS